MRASTLLAAMALLVGCSKDAATRDSGGNGGEDAGARDGGGNSGIEAEAGTPDGGGVEADAGAGDGGRAGDGGVTAQFSSLYADYFGTCGNCHAPGAPGRTSDIEQTLDFSTRATAYTTITTGSATGLVGNATACNSVPFITRGDAAASLIVAALDQSTRQAFDYQARPDCDVGVIGDETVKVGTPPSAEFIAALKTWIQAGAPND